MDVSELYKYAYIKKPLSNVYTERISVPDEFLMDWLKDSHDYQRLHTEDELRQFLSLTPEQILNWLEEATEFVWETKRNLSY